MLQVGIDFRLIHFLIFSNGDVKLNYTSKPYIVNMTTTQMSVLLLFDKSDTLSYLELQETTTLSDEQFPR